MGQKIIRLTWKLSKRINHRHKQKLFLVSALLVCALIFINFFLGNKTNHLVMNEINYDSSSSNAFESKPVLLGNLSPFLKTYQGIDISFRMRAVDDNYDNSFQTGDGNHAIRLEVTHPHTLNLSLSDNRYVKVTNDFSLNEWHSVRIGITRGLNIALTLDGVERLRITDPDVTNIEYDLSSIAVGTGYSKSRNFQGQIKDFKISVTSNGRSLIIELLAGLLLIIMSVLGLTLIHPPVTPTGSLETQNAFLNDIFVIGALVTSAALSYTFASWFIPRLSKWIPYIFSLAVIPVLLVLIKHQPRPWKETGLSRYLAIALSLFALIVLVVMMIHSFAMLPLRGTSLSFWLMVIFASVYMAAFSSIGFSNKHERVIFGLVSIILSLATWSSFLQLRNCSNLIMNFALSPVSSSLIFIGCFLVLLFVMFGRIHDLAPKRESHSSTLARFHLPVILPCAVLFLLSFRFDTLFLGTSEMHWEYFVGPIRGLRNGGWLLWDTPSQYGFLNILGASLVPFGNSWQALYLFQGSLLFVTGMLVLRTSRPTKHTSSRSLLTFLVVLCALFFADPHLIGPYLYPSSSVMRFFWCYAILFYLVHASERQHGVKRFLFWSSLLWILSVLWSAESAFYNTVIYISSLLVHLIQRIEFQQSHMGSNWRFLYLYKHISIYCLAPIIFLLFAFTVVSCYYKLVLGIFPDWRAFYEYSVSYASGFGELKFSPWGPVWLLFILFFGTTVLFVRLFGKAPSNPQLVPLGGAISCLWAVSSYYLGRSTPDNITAILPILVIVVLISFNISRSIDYDFTHVVLNAISFPLLILVLSTVFVNKDLITSVTGFRTLTKNVSERLRHADPELSLLLRKAGVGTHDAVVYYGYDVSMPKWEIDGHTVISDYSWLPTPLQLLETPIPDYRREVLVSRSVQRNPRSGYLLYAKGETEIEAAKWSALIRKTHKPSRVYENERYTITQFEVRTQSGNGLESGS